MTLEWRTYDTIPGDNKIVDPPFLAGRLVVFVEREGVGQEGRTVVALGERGWHKEFASGKLSFGNNYFGTGEKVFVLTKY